MAGVAGGGKNGEEGSAPLRAWCPRGRRVGLWPHGGGSLYCGSLPGWV